MSSLKLSNFSTKSLADMAKSRGVRGWHSMRKEQLVKALLRAVRQKPTKSKIVELKPLRPKPVLKESTELSTFIVISDEQARIIMESAGHIEIRDRQGRVLGTASSVFTETDAALAKKQLASKTPRFTTKQVLRHLRSLETK